MILTNKNIIINTHSSPLVSMRFLGGPPNLLKHENILHAFLLKCIIRYHAACVVHCRCGFDL